MQAKVPKFIDVEDRVVGPLTWRQFAYMAFGFSFAFLAFSQFQSYIGVPLGFSIASLAVALAFVKVNGRPFTTFLYSFWQFNTNPHRYFWKQEHEIPTVDPLPRRQTAGTKKGTAKQQIVHMFSVQSLKRVTEALDALEPPMRKAERERQKLEEAVPGIVVQNFRQEKEGSKASLLFPDLAGK